MIFYLANIFLLTAVSAIPSGRVDVVYPSVETSRSGEKTIKFKALDQDIELKLKPAGEILARNFALVDENDQMYYSIDVEDLKRRIYRDSDKGAALLIDEDGPLTIQGIVNSNMRIAPYESGRMVKDGRIAHQIVEVISDKNSFMNDVVTTDINRKLENVERRAGKKKCIVIEYLCVTESNFTKRFNTDKALTEYVTILFTGVQNLLEKLNLGIKVRLLGIQAFKIGTEPSFIKDSAIPGHEKHLDPVDLVVNMGKYYCKNDSGLAKEADIIMLILSRKLGELEDDGTVSFNTAGISQGGGVCIKCHKVGVAQDDSDYNERVDTVAHETAHLIGSPHDGEGPEEMSIPDNPGAKNCSYDDGYIMGSHNDEVNKFKFSECTKKCIEHLLSLPQAACLYEDCK
ncbi:venom metalloproteinase antarease-like TtrivMP_A isoform X1 [Centruroides sculpturatus]|uniref:venom metalloproteinase antarease-like TtrivMP_A isoform X1 n=1 Tax=Centruroides sculpturatus TaxID=218467 RepID=UPI000C6E33A1|nr:venom metalloproteinase antarease-like TtrivMP_A isoform X1 [Centruroides sculpturatus]